MFKNLVKKGLFAMLLIATQFACSVFGIRSEETPKYEVLLKDDDKEIRTYAPYIVAKTLMPDDSDQSRSAAFRVIAGYIFGGNEKKQSISMTAPVAQKPSKSNEKIAMTAPVSQKKNDQGFEMTFMMPSKFKLEDLPTPNDSRVEFGQIPAQIIAAIRYSGLGRTQTKAKKAAELRAWIVGQAQYEIESDAIWSGYDPPWTLPFFRRLEIMFELRKK